MRLSMNFVRLFPDSQSPSPGLSEMDRLHSFAEGPGVHPTMPMRPQHRGFNDVPLSEHILRNSWTSDLHRTKLLF